ncbi:MAG: molecular chaperone TorD family protein [Terriglobia bacterium]|nr:molecular chaperone TorD family protein [Terriglobia bacterium]
MTVYSLFADILDYPERSITSAIDDCLAELALEAADAHAHLVDFQTAIAAKDIRQLQELYTNAFDLRPECTPNLGYHLFGDDGRRGAFLAELKGRMDARGVPLGIELADHIALILRFLDVAEDERPVLTEDCLLPAVSKMIEVLQGSENLYEHALRALLGLLQQTHEAFVASAVRVEA